MESALWACDISNWYKNPVLAKVTFPTRFVELPEGFIARLLSSEGLFARQDENADFGEWSDDDTPSATKMDATKPEEANAEDDQQDRRERQQETFPEFEASIKQAIDRWTVSGAEGGVFPRLNWSSPLDAHWMGIGGSLRCTSVAEVVRFLEASDAVRSDLEQLQAFQSAANPAHPWKPQLALRKWHDFHTPSEFRCFVKNGRLIALSQKDITHFWPFLADSKDSHLQKIHEFFHKTIKGAIEIEDYVFDAYQHSNGKTYLIDISPFHEEHIEPLMWTWEELNELAAKSQASDSSEHSELPPIRVIETETSIMPNLRRMASALPFDLLQPQYPADADPDAAMLEAGLDGVNTNDIEALVARLQRITDHAEAMNDANK